MSMFLYLCYCARATPTNLSLSSVSNELYHVQIIVTIAKLRIVVYNQVSKHQHKVICEPTQITANNFCTQHD